MHNYLQDGLAGSTTVLLTILLLFRIRGVLRRPHDLAGRTFLFVILTVQITTVIANTRVAKTIDDVSGSPQLSQLL